MQQFIVGNWKMNGTKEEAQKLSLGFLKRIQEAQRPLPHIVLCPSYPYLLPVHEILKNSPIQVGAQDCHYEKCGSYTGDVSVYQIADVGCKFVLVGHSERRHHHKEASPLIRKKIESAIRLKVRPILCVGESGSERQKGHAFEIVENQLKVDMPDTFAPNEVIVAYEPLWAIGSGELPSLEEIEEMMGFIKHLLAQKIPGGGLVPILYGGSVNEKNAKEILSISNVDGLLVGGASLILEEFWHVINASTQ